MNNSRGLARLTDLVLLRQHIRLVHKHLQVHTGVFLVRSDDRIRQLHNRLLIKVLWTKTRPDQ